MKKGFAVLVIICMTCLWSRSSLAEEINELGTRIIVEPTFIGAPTYDIRVNQNGSFLKFYNLYYEGALIGNDNNGDGIVRVLSNIINDSTKLKVEYNKSKDANLVDILINLKPLENFSPEVNKYTITLPYGTVDVPGVSIALSNNKAQYIIVPTDELPGSTNIQVTSEDGKTIIRYTIEFKVEESLYVADILQNNVLLVGEYAFDLNKPVGESDYNLNNFIRAAQTAYVPGLHDIIPELLEIGDLYEVYYKWNGKWYNIIGDDKMQYPIKDLKTINGNGTYLFMNMKKRY